MTRPVLLAVLLVAGALLAAPAHAQGEGEGRTIAVKILLHDAGFLHIAPERIDARVGDTIVAEVANQGSSKHNVIFCSGPVEGTTCPDRFAFTPLLDPGASRNVTFTVDAPGTFEYFCDIPGHRQGNMRGELIVQGEAKKESPAAALPLVLLALLPLALSIRRR